MNDENENGIPDEVEEDVSQLPAYILPSWAYLTLKWATLVGLPLVSVAYPALAAVWGWPLSDEVSRTATIAALVCGVTIGISQIKSMEGK